MQQGRVFKIVIAYDNLAAAVRAKEIAERVAGGLESEWDIWPFELLKGGYVSEYAANTAVQSNMLIIATGGQDDLPDWIKDWIEGWVPQKAFTPSVLVGVLDDEARTWNEPPPAYDYLSQAAKRGRMDFFCNLGP